VRVLPTERRRAALAAALLACGCAAGPGVLPNAADPIAILPPENSSALGGEGAVLGEEIAADLASRGIALVPPEAIDAALREGDVRYPADMAPSSAAAVSGALHTSRLLAASVIFAESDPEPEYAIEMRLLDGASGDVVRSWIGGLSGAELAEGFGPPIAHDVDAVRHAIVSRAVAEMLERDRPSDSVHGAGIREWRSKELRLKPDDRVAVLPLRNASDVDPGTGFAFARALSTSLHSAARVRTVPVQLLVAGLESAGARDPIELDEDRLRELGKQTGAVWLVSGSLTVAQEGGGRIGEDPKLAVVVHAVDVRTAKVVWSAAIERRGGVEPGLLALDRERSLAELVVSASWLLALSFAGEDAR
jgi:hypothetical protein